MVKPFFNPLKLPMRHEKQFLLIYFEIVVPVKIKTYNLVLVVCSEIIFVLS